MDFPTVTVTTRLPGAAPEQVESEVTDKVEEAVNTISGIDQLSSNSAEGISQVIVTFRLEKNADVAAQEVRDRINRILPLLPRTITQPTIEKQDPDAAPILTIAVTAKKPIRDVTEYTDKVLRRRLESADGVGQVLVLGGRKRQINVWVDGDRLRAYNLTVNDVARTLQSQNADIPGGRIDEGAQSITMRTRGRVETPEEFGDLVLRQVDGHPVQVNDVGRVDDGVAEARTLASINGDPTVLLQIRKQSGTNTVEVVNNVKERLADVQQALPPGYQLRIVRDGAEFIEASIRSVEEHLVVGSFLAAFVVLLFLGNLRSTIIAAISIPTSIIATFALLWYNGFTLNMLTMLALTLSVGIVIDDAIVVLENIYRFIEEKGMSPMQAAIEGTQGDRARGHGHDAVAGGDLRAGGLHERHGRPLHAQLRPDDGVRGDGVAARQLHAGADDERAVAEGEAADRGRGSSRPRLEALEDLRAARSRLHAHARVVDGASRHRRGARGGGAVLERADVPDRQRQLHAAGRSVRVRRQPARA